MSIETREPERRDADGGDGLQRSTYRTLDEQEGRLPVSTPPNSIVYSSGLLPITRMLKAGAVFDIIGAVLCVVGVIAMANLVGLA